MQLNFIRTEKLLTSKIIISLKFIIYIEIITFIGLYPLNTKKIFILKCADQQKIDLFVEINAIFTMRNIPNIPIFG